MEDNYEHVDPQVIYVPTNIPGKGCNADLFDTEPCEGCKCSTGTASCSDSNCSCLISSGGTPNYDSSGRLVNKSGPMVECRATCLCRANTCRNRVVQV